MKLPRSGYKRERMVLGILVGACVANTLWIISGTIANAITGSWWLAVSIPSLIAMPFITLWMARLVPTSEYWAYHWNDDKPHRCPLCHMVWDWDGVKVRSYLRIRRGPIKRFPSRYIPIGWLYRAWWVTNTCPYCDTPFSGRSLIQLPDMEYQ